MKVFGSETIENFILGKLSTEEAQEIASAIEKDPALKQEVDLQNQLINSIKEARKAELKARLNNIPVSSGIATSTKVILGTAAVAGLLLASWFAFSPNSTTEIGYTEEIEIIEELTTSNETNEVVEVETINEEIVEIEVENTEVSSTVATRQTNTNTEIKPNTTTTDRNATTATPFVPNPADDNEGGFTSKTNLEDVPANNLSNVSSYQTNKKIVPVIEHSNKARKYKFDGENLTLIGDFSSDTPYTVYEFNAISGKSLYLKFDNDYYEIKNTESKVVKLDKTTSPEIIKQLENK